MSKRLIFFLTLFTLFAKAQERQLTLDDVVNGGANYNSFIPERLDQLQWIDKQHFSYVKDDTLLIQQCIKGKERLLLSLSQVVDSLGQRDQFPAHEWQSSQVIVFKLGGKRQYYHLKDKSYHSFNYPLEARNLDFDPKSQQLAYTIKNKLYIATANNAQILVAESTNSNITYGQTVHRNEFGIHKGTFWSPNGQFLAFYRKDEQLVKDYPLVNITTRQAEIESIKYPMAGMKSEEVKVGIFNVKTKSTIYLKTGLPADHYLTNIVWSPDQEEIYLAELNRGQDTMLLNAYDVQNGQFLRTLFYETDEQYVEPQNPLIFSANNNSIFLFLSRRNNYNHIYSFDISNNRTKKLSKGDYEVTKLIDWNKNEEYLTYISTEKSSLERHIYKLDLTTNKTHCLTSESGFHSAIPSPDGRYLLDIWSAVDVPRKIDLIDTKKEKSTSIFKAPNPYDNYTLGTTQLIPILSDIDSTILTGRLILPPHFDSTKVYPTIVYVYGGPHSQLVSNKWLAGVQMWQHYMAQKGYVMFTVDGHGTAYRGADFEQIIHRQLGKYEMQDQMTAYRYLSALPYVDNERIGVFGWSYGGFMTTSLMTHYPKAFKVGVAGGPVIDWSNYEVMYGERYMDTPQENPEGYDSTNLCHHAKHLEGRLLMIHGAQDPVVVWQHSQKFVRQCVEDGVPLDYFVYPTHPHNVRGKDRVHLMQKVTQYFDDFL